MTISKEYLDYAELAQAAYGKGFVPGSYFDKYGTNILLDPKNEVNFSAKQAENFANRFKVLATSQEYGIGNVSSFDAVLFGELDTQGNVVKKILAIRGSQEFIDYIVDIEELALHGTIISQTSSMEDFYQALVNDGKLSATEHIDVTGHSLGGFLAQDFTAHHSDIVNQTYTYNAPGYGGAKAEILDKLGILDPYLASSKIINIYAKEGWNATAGLGVLLGDVLAVSIDGAEGANLLNHKIGRLTESLYIYNMLSEISGEQNIDNLTSILEKVSNERVVKIVDDVFQDPQNAIGIIDQAIILTKNNQGKATCIKNLSDQTAASLNDKSLPNLYALLHSNPFAIEGNLPTYNDINPDEYSPAFMTDRANYLYYILDKENRYGDGIGKDSYKAFDSYGKTLIGKTGNQVIFGTDNLNNAFQLKGGNGNDRIYGLGGDDTYVIGRGFENITIFDEYKVDNLVSDGGNDTLYFQEDITADDLVFRKVNDDLIVSFKEDGKEYEELRDRVTFLNWINPNNRVEVIELGNGSRIRVKDILAQHSATDDIDNIELSTSSDIIDPKGGNDTYIYNCSDKIESKNTTQKPLNNIYILNIFTFIKKQNIMVDILKEVA